MKQTFQLQEIQYDEDNPRQIEQQSLDRLTSSIESVGLLHDPVVRVSPGGRIVCVAGERRIRAIKQMKDAPTQLVCEVLPWDVSADTVRFVENEQREGIHPLDQAVRVKAMVEAGISIAVVAKDLGEEQSRIRHLFMLNQLEPKIKKWYRAGQLSWELCRLLVQCRNLDRVELAGQWLGDEHQQCETLRNATMDVKALTFMMRVAPWKLDDVTLPGGACDSCPKRGGNADPTLFMDFDDDRCMDQACWHNKQRAHLVQEKQRLAREGAKVRQGRVPKNYVDITRPVKDLIPQTRSKQTIEGMVGQKIQAAYFEHNGAMRAAAPRDAIMKALGQAGMKSTSEAARESSRVNATTPDYEESRREDHAKRLKKAKAAQAVVEAVIDKVLAKELFIDGCVARWMAKLFTDQVYDATLHKMGRRLGLPVPAPATLRDWVEALHKHLDTLKDPSEVFNYLMMLQLYTHWPHSNEPDVPGEVKELCQLLKIDVRALKATAKKSKGTSKKGSQRKTSPKPAKPKKSGGTTPSKSTRKTSAKKAKPKGK